MPDFEREAQSYELNLGASWEFDLFGGGSRRRPARGHRANGRYVHRHPQSAGVARRCLRSAEIQQQLVELVALRYQKGVAAELQLRQAEGSLAQVSATVTELEQNLDSAMNALDILLGVQPGTTRPQLAAAAQIPVPPAVSSAGGAAELLRRRPNIIAAERTLAASNARIGVAMAEYYPKFSLSGLLGTATRGPGGLLSGDARQAGGVLGLHWRLFDFGRVDAEIAAAMGRNTEALAAYRLTVLRASEDVENAFSALVRQRARAQMLADGGSSLTRACTSSFAAYRGGVSTLLEVLDADRRLLESRDAEVQARTAAAHATVASFRALGGRLERSGSGGRLSVPQRNRA